jgi:hypothetical protein
MLEYADHAQRTQGAKPEQHHRAEQRADAGRAARLDKKDAGQDDQGERYDIRLEHRRGDFQPLDRREHRHCRRNHRIAIKQRGAENAQGGQQP